MEAEPWKLLLGGESSVGKTQIRHRYSNFLAREDFQTQHVGTIGAEFRRRNHVIGGEDQREPHCSLNIQIWDLAGGHRYRPLAKMSSCPLMIMLVYDVTSDYSVEQLVEWWFEILSSHDVPADTHLVVIGNKGDLLDDGGASLMSHEAQTSGTLPPDVAVDSTAAVQTAAAFCEKEQLPHYVVSAKTGAGVQEALQAAVIASRRRHNRPVHGLRGGARLPLAPPRVVRGSGDCTTSTPADSKSKRKPK